MGQTTLHRTTVGSEPSYLVKFEGQPIGRVWQRRGGWWAWQSSTVTGSGSWCRTRKEAVERVVAFHAER